MEGITVTVRVPGTSANLGPGFDAFGVALSVFNEFTFEITGEESVIIGLPGELTPNEPEKSLPFESFRRAVRFIESRTGVPLEELLRGLKVTVKAGVPVSRGLGSSATCIVAGVLAACEIVRRTSGVEIKENETFELAVEVEGHPDNVVPAMVGGFCISHFDGRKVTFKRLEFPAELAICALIPNFTVPTKKARAVLPSSIPMSDATFNIAHASLFVASLLTKDYELLRKACRDKLHQPYRASLVPGFAEIIDVLYELGAFAAYLSGAGPTIAAIILAEDARGFQEKLRTRLESFPGGWEPRIMSVVECGASVFVHNVPG